MTDLVAGVDGGNSKTELVLGTRGGSVLARVRGPGTRPDLDGAAVTSAALAELLVAARSAAGLPASRRVRHWVGCIANVDTRAVERDLTGHLVALDVAEEVEVCNDTFAVLWAGAPESWGVAVTCGAGINALGLHPDGRVARFLGIGATSGDWGGGYALGDC